MEKTWTIAKQPRAIEWRSSRTDKNLTYKWTTDRTDTVLPFLNCMIYMLSRAFLFVALSRRLFNHLDLLVVVPWPSLFWLSVVLLAIAVSTSLIYWLPADHFTAGGFFDCRSPFWWSPFCCRPFYCVGKEYYVYTEAGTHSRAKRRSTKKIRLIRFWKKW